MTPSSENVTDENPELAFALELVEHTGHHVFLTGKAGTGKTTFLKNLRKHTAKRMVVTAPTGVAAINAGGVTLHSFFQLPFGPNIPGGGGYGQGRDNRFRFSRKKIQIMKSLDLLVIDEISMVRADVLDAVDGVLRHHRRNNSPFGGVQLLMIGDLYQLSPVARPEEWDLLRSYYDSVYFFSSRALAGVDLFTIELKRIYRQSDDRFIDLLNRVRDNRLEAVHMAELNRMVVENFSPEDKDGYITLTTHNRTADAINKDRLDRLAGKAFQLTAEIEGEFPEQNYPTFETLVLKAGAQVMFLRNDASFERRYYNGMIGSVVGISSDTVRIRCPEEIDDIEVEKASWENITYTLNEETRDIEENIIGAFKQFPLRLAWAVTIHKSQGLTFEKAVIDSQAAFAHGQVYVALSRCKTLGGMVLRSPVPVRGLGTDASVARFMAEVRDNPPTAGRLLAAKREYQEKLLVACFDFQTLNHRLNSLVRNVRTHGRVLKVNGGGDLNDLVFRAGEEIIVVGEKFKNQLRGRFSGHVLPEADDYIKERAVKASVWFQEKIASVFDDLLHHMTVETDNRDIGKTIHLALNDLRREIMVKRAAVQSCEKGFSPQKYLRAVSRADVDAEAALAIKPAKGPVPEYTESDIENPVLFQQLKDWRNRKAKEKGVPAYQVLHQRVLIQIAVCLPDTVHALKKIKGLGDKTVGEYGADLVSLVAAYREKHGIEKVNLPEPRSAALEPKDKKGPAPDTRQVTFTMFRDGMDLPRIARERGLALSTVESHLCPFVESGELDVEKLLSPEKLRLIEQAITETGGNSSKAVKEILGDGVSYGEIRMVVAHRTYLGKKMAS
jgi:hypothetical protein